jgi:hypothetical protein
MLSLIYACRPKTTKHTSVVTRPIAVPWSACITQGLDGVNTLKGLECANNRIHSVYEESWAIIIITQIGIYKLIQLDGCSVSSWRSYSRCVAEEVVVGNVSDGQIDYVISIGVGVGQNTVDSSVTRS